MRVFIKIFLIVFLSTFGNIAFAGVVFNEIMYDLKEGSDTGREWIEIVNTGTTPTSLTGWKLFEANTNHGLTLSQGSEIIAGSAFAIIASDPAKFLIDYPGFSGTIFDSSFSLLNTGESLNIRDSNLLDIDLVTYSSDQGGTGDGNSLQKLSGVWKGGIPTPGKVNSIVSSVSASSESSTGETASNIATSTGSGISFSIEPQIFASAGEKKRTATVGGTTTFSGSVWGLKKEPIENARMLWNFGDGGTGAGRSVMHAYKYPGTYVVILDASSGYYAATDRVTVEVTSADVFISSIGDAASFYVELQNRSPLELDLSGWSIRTTSQIFVIPQNTFIASSKKVRFSADVTKFNVFTTNVSLFYPNGVSATTYSEKQNNLLTNDTSVSVTTQRGVQNTKINTTTKKETKIVELENILTSSEKVKLIENNSLGIVGGDQAASSLGANKPGDLFWWLSGVSFLALLGVATSFVLAKKSPSELIMEEAKSYTIVEEEEDGKIPF